MRACMHICMNVRTYVHVFACVYVCLSFVKQIKNESMEKEHSLQAEKTNIYNKI
jgi:hypothetical protein